MHFYVYYDIIDTISKDLANVRTEFRNNIKEKYKMDQKKIDRINELARKSKAEGLTEAEKAEQTALRNEYRQAVVGNLASQLDHTYIMTPDGKKRKVGHNN